MKYHVNPKTGNTGRCNARNACPFGGTDGTENHFDSQQEATVHAEKIMSKLHSTLPTAKKAKTTKEKKTEQKADELAEASDKLTIGLDLDNTFSDFSGSMRDFIAEKAELSDNQKHDLMPEPDSYSMDNWEWDKLPYDNTLEALRAAEVEGLYAKQKANEGAVKALTELQAAGHSVHVVTARNEKWKEDTKKAMEYWGIEADKLVFEDKKHTYEEVDVFIDDAPYQLSRFNKLSIPSVVFTQKYNAHMEDLHGRVDSWAEAGEVFNRLAKKKAQGLLRRRKNVKVDPNDISTASQYDLMGGK